MKQQGHIKNLDVFRALAALAVCFFHFNRFNYLGDGVLSTLFAHGDYGVDVFFVISGFVIPLSLQRINFDYSGTGRFLYARFLRLYPAYIAAAALALILWVGSSLLPGFRGEAPVVTLGILVGNITLLADFMGTAWLIPIFWTLAIEAQFYLFISLTFPLLVGFKKFRYPILLVWILAPLLVGVGPSVFTWTALFAMGILTFWKRQELESDLVVWGFLILAALSHYYVKGVLSSVLGVCTVLAILYAPEIKSKILIWIGAISYSLYLFHIPIGGRIINFSERYPLGYTARLCVILAAVAVSIVAAAIMYYLIEKPSHEYSRAVKKREK